MARAADMPFKMVLLWAIGSTVFALHQEYMLRVRLSAKLTVLVRALLSARHLKSGTRLHHAQESDKKFGFMLFTHQQQLLSCLSVATISVVISRQLKMG